MEHPICNWWVLEIFVTCMTSQMIYLLPKPITKHDRHDSMGVMNSLCCFPYMDRKYDVCMYDKFLIRQECGMIGNFHGGMNR